MVNLLSKRVANRTDELARELQTASEDTVKRDEQRDGQKPAAREAMSPIAAPVSVVAIRTEVGAMEPVRVPERAEDETENQRDCEEDQYGWNNDKCEHCVFSVETALREIRLTECEFSGEPGRKVRQNGLRRFREASLLSRWP